MSAEEGQAVGNSQQSLGEGPDLAAGGTQHRGCLVRGSYRGVSKQRQTDFSRSSLFVLRTGQGTDCSGQNLARLR